MDYTRVKHQSAAGNFAFIIKYPKGATVLLSKDGSYYASFRDTLMVRETTHYVGWALRKYLPKTGAPLSPEATMRCFSKKRLVGCWS